VKSQERKQVQSREVKCSDGAMVLYFNHVGSGKLLKKGGCQDEGCGQEKR
jgi:hypothetical protein